MGIQSPDLPVCLGLVGTKTGLVCPFQERLLCLLGVRISAMIPSVYMDGHARLEG